jgi:flavin reductase (DIM6/NTAB) family NADH-FMN oxidoreductase RutF
MLTIDPLTTPQKDMHQYLLASVAPRPIAFVSTIDGEGNANLAPYSFYNAFSSNPPIVVFSSNRRSDNNTTKDTLHNIEQNMEAVVNVVSHNIVRQMTLASIDYDHNISEFDKAGFTEVPSELVKPPRVLESPVQMECKVSQIIALGDGPGAGHLIICHVVKMHIDERVLDDQNRIDVHKIDLMGRMGRAFYVRASGEAVMPILQPFNEIGIGFDQLPKSILHSAVLSGNEIAEIASLPALPDAAAVNQYWEEHQLSGKFADLAALHTYAKAVIKQREIAAKLLMGAEFGLV